MKKKTYYFCYPRCLQECPHDDVHSYFLCADNGRNGKALHHQLLQLHDGRHWQVPVTMLFWNSASDSGPFFQIRFRIDKTWIRIVGKTSIRQDPDPKHCFEVVFAFFRLQNLIFLWQSPPPPHHHPQANMATVIVLPLPPSSRDVLYPVMLLPCLLRCLLFLLSSYRPVIMFLSL